jgi:hypothetical protein
MAGVLTASGRRRPIVLRAAIAALAATAFNLLLRDIVRAAAHVPDAFDPFTWPPIVVATLAGVAGGTVVYAVLRAFLGARADRVFTIVASVLLIVSLITPITLLWSSHSQYPGTTLLTVASLEVMHISTAVAAIVALAGKRAPKPTLIAAQTEASI